MLSIQTPVSFRFYGRVSATNHDEEMQIGWSVYGPQIWDGIEAAKMLLGADYNYQENVDAVRDKSVSSALPGDLSTWFTWMSRGERFCDGFLAEQISDGGLYAVVKRLEELIAAGVVSYPPEATRKQ